VNLSFFSDMPWQTYSEWKGEGSNESGVKKNSSPGAKKEVKEAKGRKTDKEPKEEKTGKVGNDGLLVDFAKLSSKGEVSTFTPEEARENTIKEMNSIVDLTRFLEKEGISCCLVAECALFRYKSRKTTIYVRLLTPLTKLLYCAGWLIPIRRTGSCVSLKSCMTKPRT
jgi:hypothetical protein